MKRATSRAWVWAFLREWVGPKIGVIVAVVPLASIILKLVDQAHAATGDTQQAQMSLADEALSLMVELVTRSTTGAAIWFYIVPGILWLLPMVAKGYVVWGKPKPGALFNVSRMIGPVSALFGIFAGGLVVPLTLAMTIIWEHGSAGDLAMLSFMSGMYVGLSAWLHYTGFTAGELPNAITYAVTMPAKTAVDDAHAKAVLETLQNHVTGLPWIGEAQYVSQSDDGDAIIVLPITRKAAHWKKDEARVLMTRLKQKVEPAWAAQGLTIRTKVIPFAIQEKAPLASLKSSLPSAQPIPTPTPLPPAQPPAPV